MRKKIWLTALSVMLVGLVGAVAAFADAIAGVARDQLPPEAGFDQRLARNGAQARHRELEYAAHRLPAREDQPWGGVLGRAQRHAGQRGGRAD